MSKILSCIIIVFCFPVCIYSQTFKIEGAYEYPIKSDTAKWKSMKLRSERVEACQFPDEILKELSIEQLLETCLNYPFMIDILAFNDIQVGFTKVASEFNGLQELLKRKENAKAIMNYYCSIDPFLVNNLDPGLERGIIPLRMSYIEVLLFQDEVMNNLPRESEIKLIEEFVRKYEDKLANNYYRGRHSFSILAMSLNKALAKTKATEINVNSAQIDVYSSFEADKNPDSVFRGKRIFNELKK